MVYPLGGVTQWLHKSRWASYPRVHLCQYPSNTSGVGAGKAVIDTLES